MEEPELLVLLELWEGEEEDDDEEEDEGGWNAIIDLSDGLQLESLLCLEYEAGGMRVAAELPRPIAGRLLELRDILASVELGRGTWRVGNLGRSDGADLVLPLSGPVFISVRRTLLLVPAGLSKVGANLLAELLLPFLWLFGGLPRGARTGEREGSLFPPALLESVGDTTAAAAAIRLKPEVPCSSMLLTRELGGRE